MTDEPTTTAPDASSPPMSDRQRAFKRYKAETAAHGKPFFPFGVYHDTIAAAVVMAIIVLLSIVWFAQANCDSFFNVSCHVASTPAQQEAHKPLLGPLYEAQADPATTSYHPRPEWYFYFLFYLLIVFSNPYLVVLGTIGVPTILLVALLAWPFIDRKRERRPSRRPVAMATMVGTAVLLLSFTYLGSQAGKNEAPKGLTEAQVAMPGYKLIYEDPRGDTCFGCHKIVTGAGNVGPDLTNEATRNHDLQWQIQHLIKPSSKTPGSVMPPQDKTWNSEEIAQIAAFVDTLGASDRATDPTYKNVTADAVKSAESSDADSGSGKGASTTSGSGDGDSDADGK